MCVIVLSILVLQNISKLHFSLQKIVYLSTEFPWWISWGGNESDDLSVVTDGVIVVLVDAVEVSVVIDDEVMDDDTMGKSS